MRRSPPLLNRSRCLGSRLCRLVQDTHIFIDEVLHKDGLQDFRIQIEIREDEHDQNQNHCNQDGNSTGGLGGRSFLLFPLAVFLLSGFLLQLFLSLLFFFQNGLLFLTGLLFPRGLLCRSLLFCIFLYCRSLLLCICLFFPLLLFRTFGVFLLLCFFSLFSGGLFLAQFGGGFYRFLRLFLNMPIFARIAMGSITLILPMTTAA